MPPLVPARAARARPASRPAAAPAARAPPRRTSGAKSSYQRRRRAVVRDRVGRRPRRPPRRRSATASRGPTGTATTIRAAPARAQRAHRREGGQRRSPARRRRRSRCARDVERRRARRGSARRRRAQLAQLARDRSRSSSRCVMPEPARGLGVEHAVAVLGDRADAELRVAPARRACAPPARRAARRAPARPRRPTGTPPRGSATTTGRSCAKRQQPRGQPPPSVATVHELHAHPRARGLGTPHPPAPPGFPASRGVAQVRTSPRPVRGPARMRSAGGHERTPAVTVQAPPAAAPRSIGIDLERQRLEHRARRIKLAIAALRRIADAHAPNGPAPAPLQQAIAGFSAEHARVDRHLAEL